MALQPLTPDQAYSQASASDIAANPKGSFLLPSVTKAPVVRTDENSLRGQLDAVSELMESAYRAGLRGDVEKARSRVADIETFIDNNADLLEQFANSRARSEESQLLRKRAADLLTSEYLRTKRQFGANGSEEFSLNDLMSEDNPNAQIFAYNKQMRSMGDTALDSLATGSSDLQQLSTLYQQRMGIKVGEDGEYRAGPMVNLEEQQFFKDLMHRHSAGELGELDDTAITMAAQAAIQGSAVATTKDGRPVFQNKSMAQMRDTFDTIVSMAGGDFSAMNISQAVTDYEDAEARIATLPETGRRNYQASQDILGGARVLLESSAYNDEGGRMPAQDFISAAAHNERLLAEYNTLSGSGFFDGLNNATRKAATAALVAIHLQDQFGGVGDVSKYASNTMAQRIKTFVDTSNIISQTTKMAEELVVDEQDFLAAEGDLGRAEAAILVKEPLSVFSSTLNAYLAEVINKDPAKFQDTDAALTALANDQRTPQVLAGVLMRSFDGVSKSVAENMATAYVNYLAKSSEEFDVSALFKAMTTVKAGTAQTTANTLLTANEEAQKRVLTAGVMSRNDALAISAYNDYACGLTEGVYDEFVLPEVGKSVRELGADACMAVNSYSKAMFGSSADMDRAFRDSLVSTTANNFGNNIRARIQKISDAVAKGEKDETAAQQDLGTIVNNLMSGSDGLVFEMPTQLTKKVTTDDRLVTLHEIVQQLSTAPGGTEFVAQQLGSMVQAIAKGKTISEAAAGPLQNIFSTYAAFAPVTDPTALAYIRDGMVANVHREAAIIRHGININEKNGITDLQLGAEAAKTYKDQVDKGLQYAAKFLENREFWNGANGMNASSLYQSSKDPSQLASVQLSLTLMLESSDPEVRKVAQDTIYALTALSQGEAAAQRSVDLNSTLAHGAKFLEEAEKIVGGTNEQLSKAAKTTRTWNTVINLAPIPVGGLSAFGRHGFFKGMGLTKRVLFSGGIMGTDAALMSAAGSEGLAPEINSTEGLSRDPRQAWMVWGQPFENTPGVQLLTQDTPRNANDGLLSTIGSYAASGAAVGALAAGPTAGTSALGGAFVGSLVGAAAWGANEIAAMLKESDITDEHYEELNNLLAGIIQSVYDDKSISESCKDGLVNAKAAIDDYSLDPQDRFEKTYGLLRDFMALTRSKYEGSTAEATRSLKSLYPGDTVQKAAERRLEANKARGLLFSETSDIGMCPNEKIAAQTREALLRCQTKQVSLLYTPTVKRFTNKVMTDMPFVKSGAKARVEPFVTDFVQKTLAEYHRKRNTPNAVVSATAEQYLYEALYGAKDAEGNSWVDRLSARMIATATAVSKAETDYKAEAKEVAAEKEQERELETYEKKQKIKNAQNTNGTFP